MVNNSKEYTEIAYVYINSLWDAFFTAINYIKIKIENNKVVTNQLKDRNNFNQLNSNSRFYQKIKTFRIVKLL